MGRVAVMRRYLMMPHTHYETDLLFRLGKYAPTANVDPVENFLTEAFAFVLQQFAEVRAPFLREFCGVGDGFRECAVETQRGLPNGSIIDIVLRRDDLILYVENKVWSDLNVYVSEGGLFVNQVEHYVASVPLSKTVPVMFKLITSRPVYGLRKQTRGRLVFDPIHDHIRWAQVYKMLLAKRASCQEPARFCVEALLTFLEEHDMAPFEGIGKNINEMALIYESIRPVSEKLKTKLTKLFRAFLEEVMREANIKAYQYKPSVESMTAHIRLGKSKVWLSIDFGSKSFLRLRFGVWAETRRLVDEESLKKVVSERGYSQDGWKNYVKAMHLPQEQGEEGGQHQIVQAAEFLKCELAAWEPLLRG